MPLLWLRSCIAADQMPFMQLSRGTVLQAMSQLWTELERGARRSTSSHTGLHAVIPAGVRDSASNRGATRARRISPTPICVICVHLRIDSPQFFISCFLFFIFHCAPPLPIRPAPKYEISAIPPILPTKYPLSRKSGMFSSDLDRPSPATQSATKSLYR